MRIGRTGSKQQHLHHQQQQQQQQSMDKFDVAAATTADIVSVVDDGDSPIWKLNEYCLLEIFKNLSVQDVLSVMRCDYSNRYSQIRAAAKSRLRCSTATTSDSSNNVGRTATKPDDGGGGDDIIDQRLSNGNGGAFIFTNSLILNVPPSILMAFCESYGQTATRIELVAVNGVAALTILRHFPHLNHLTLRGVTISSDDILRAIAVIRDYDADEDSGSSDSSGSSGSSGSSDSSSRGGAHQRSQPPPSYDIVSMLPTHHLTTLRLYYCRLDRDLLLQPWFRNLDRTPLTSLHVSERRRNLSPTHYRCLTALHHLECIAINGATRMGSHVEDLIELNSPHLLALALGGRFDMAAPPATNATDTVCSSTPETRSAGADLEQDGGSGGGSNAMPEHGSGSNIMMPIVSGRLFGIVCGLNQLRHLTLTCYTWLLYSFQSRFYEMLPMLQTLNLTRVTNANLLLNQLGCRNRLLTLSVALVPRRLRTTFDEVDFDVFEGYTELESLRLENFDWCDEEAIGLTHLPYLKRLHLVTGLFNNYADVVNLVAYLPTLRSLTLEDSLFRKSPGELNAANAAMCVRDIAFAVKWTGNGCYYDIGGVSGEARHSSDSVTPGQRRRMRLLREQQLQVLETYKL